MFLTISELRQLTGKIHRNAQACVLCAMGIEHKLRPDGSVAVLLSHVESLMGLSSTSKKARKSTVDFGWMNE